MRDSARLHHLDNRRGELGRRKALEYLDGVENSLYEVTNVRVDGPRGGSYTTHVGCLSVFIRTANYLKRAMISGARLSGTGSNLFLREGEP